MKNIAIPQIDNASLVAFRVFFGIVAMWSSLRFVLNGWVERFFSEPTYFFSFGGFEWVKVLPLSWMYAAFYVLSILGFMIAVGFLYRLASLLYFLIFTYIELIDVTNYLNHYYLVSIVVLMLVFLPLNRRAAIDVVIRPSLYSDKIGVHALYWLRIQVGVVYVFAGLAKASSDWLIQAQPLTIWLRSRVDTPIIGGLLEYRESAYIMSWLGFLFDTTVVIWLLWPKTRKAAYIVLVGFHISTGLLFNIGMFPWIMIVAATVFFSPNWPVLFISGLRLRSRKEKKNLPNPVGGHMRRPLSHVLFIALWCSFQFLFPLRTHLYGGNVLWHEQGMRWSWRVMVREKNGSISYNVVNEDGRKQVVSPRRYLTAHQAREMSGQPDLIAKLGKHIGKKTGENVRVFVDAKVSLNGRKPIPLIDPKIDIMNVDVGILPYSWVTDAP